MEKVFDLTQEQYVAIVRICKPFHRKNKDGVYQVKSGSKTIINYIEKTIKEWPQ